MPDILITGYLIKKEFPGMKTGKSHEVKTNKPM